jgi:hypothetical protein
VEFVWLRILAMVVLCVVLLRLVMRGKWIAWSHPFAENELTLQRYVASFSLSRYSGLRLWGSGSKRRG